MKIKNYLYYFLTLLFFTQILFTKCANKVPPTGGPRDTIPPALIYSNPKHQSINVHTRVFEFNFDERIQIKNLQKQLIITPRIDFDYDVKQGKKGFFLIFDEDFDDSITYTFNFRDAIQDLTESNPTRDNKFTFSTGPEIDSLSIDGYAINLLTKDTIKEALIGIFRIDDTTNIFNGSPYYFAETDEEGYYKLDNIKEGKYRLYGFKDSNNNLELESKSEDYAFKIDTIELKDHLKNQNLYFFHLDFRELKNTTALPSGKHFDINYNKTLIDYDIIPIYKKIKLYTDLVKEDKSVRVYNTFDNPDSTAIQITATDSIFNKLTDTVWVKFNESQRKPEEFQLNLKPATKSDISTNYVAEISISKPLLKLNADSILFKYDTIPVSYIEHKEQILTNKHINEFRLLFTLNKTFIDSIKTVRDSINTAIAEAQFKKDSIENIETNQTEKLITDKKSVSDETSKKTVSQGLHLYLGKGAFISAENDTSNNSVYNYKFLDPIEYGTIKGKAVTNGNLFIIQLLDTKNTIIKEFYTKENFEFLNVKPGDYRLRILVDENNNGKWDYGNIIENIPPEPVFFYTNPEGTFDITVRANWHMTDLIIQQ